MAPRVLLPISVRSGSLLALSLLSFTAAPTSAYIYHFEYDISGVGEGESSQSAMVFSEGPMYVAGKAPAGDGESSITIDVKSKGGSRKTGPYTDDIAVHAVFVDTVTVDSLGPPSQRDSNPLGRNLCCTSSLYSSGGCGLGVNIGELVVFPASADAAPQINSWDVQVESPLLATAKWTVVREGWQALYIVACDTRGAFSLPSYPLTVDIVFRNPYGYLPGTVYGIYPLYGVLLAIYVLATLIFIVRMVKERKHLLPLQYGVLALFAFGTLEVAVWVGTYRSKNESGIPTPCSVCPTTSDFIAAVVLNVFKRGASNALLLAVSLGYGVVHETLSRKQVGLIALLTVFFILFGALDEVEKATAYSLGASAWSTPVFLADIAFFIWTYQSLVNIIASLKSSRQTEKFRMYQLLLRTLVASAVLFIIAAFSVILVSLGVMPLEWKGLFLLDKFWDVIYFGVLAAVAWIWSPGPTAYRYSLYSQPGTEPDGGPEAADAAEDVGRGEEGEEGQGQAQGEAGVDGGALGPQDVSIEMAGRKGATDGEGTVVKKGAKGSGAASPQSRPGTFVIQEEDDEEEDEREVARLPTAGGGQGGSIDTRPVNADKPGQSV
jgi:hypothetical protein